MSIRVRFGSKADICSATSDERQVPIADVAASLDHSIGTRGQAGRDVDASWPLSLRRHRRIEGPPRFLQHRMRLLYRRTPTRLTPPFALPPAL
jgi:hypothetical protein